MLLTNYKGREISAWFVGTGRSVKVPLWEKVKTLPCSGATPGLNGKFFLGDGKNTFTYFLLFLDFSFKVDANPF